jgi:hypothetical protein
MDHREDAAEALERGIGASRDLVSQLLGDPARVPYELRLGAARRANELGR